MMIKAIVFDFDDTLYVGDVWRGWKEYIHENLKKVLKTDENCENFLKKHNFSEKPSSTEIFIALEEQGSSAKKLAKLISKNLYHHTADPQIFPREILEKLSGVASLYIVSKAEKNYLNFYIEKYGINKKYFKKIYSVNPLKRDKTKGPLYQKILKRENGNADQILVVGDDLNADIAPAQALGMQTFLFDSQNFDKIFDFLKEKGLLN